MTKAKIEEALENIRNSLKLGDYNGASFLRSRLIENFIKYIAQREDTLGEKAELIQKILVFKGKNKINAIF